MLSVLKIKNLALVDDLTWELGPGLVGVTGTTGAGKSMIVGALELILGERANHDLVRTGSTHCSVEGVFELSDTLDQVNALLEDHGLEAGPAGVVAVIDAYGIHCVAEIAQVGEQTNGARRALAGLARYQQETRQQHARPRHLRDGNRRPDTATVLLVRRRGVYPDL